MFSRAVLVLAVCVAAASALECYQCSGCEEGERGDPIQCSSSQDTCLKVVLGTRIEKSCTHKSACNLADVEKTLSGLFNDISSAFGGNSDESNEARVIHCCDDDYCNGASSMGPATVALLLTPLLLSTLLR